jgi:imidazolonepropionase
MAAAGTVAVLLPGAFYTLRETQTAAHRTFRKHRADGAGDRLQPGSSPMSSLLLTMNMACTLFRLTPEEALAGVTRNAARAGAE